ncbi:MAG TPA: HAMP domain-containing sensor histidine kinase, partial [Acidimicrobiales bacterium]|nr:HAMP domain-containing sensor histidine kinase [Acidimicrobiales bacterium]
TGGSQSPTGSTTGSSNAATTIPNESRAQRVLAERLNPDVSVIVLDHDGRVLLSHPSGSATHPDPEPQIPSRIPVQSVPPNHVFGRDEGVYRAASDSFGLTVPGQRGDVYRAQAVVVPQGVLIVATPVAATVATLQSLVKVELLASLAVVAVACALAWWLIRRELKPLQEMTVTAGAIAGGELDRRVPARDENSEVGRLGQALNGMLSQIQAAFVQKSASEERLRVFVSNASHELRTPLTSIRGYAELLRKGALRDEEARQRALSRVESEATRMGVLVDDLLLLTRLDQGRPLERVPVDLRRIGSEAVEDARAVDGERPIEFRSSGPVVVTGDRDRLRQVLHNLVRNALNHTPPGTPVTVEVLVHEGRGACRVIDRGPGMTPEQAAHAFDRFYRSDAARTGGGTGLGLSIVRAIAEALDGTASVDTAPGRGSVFIVELPLAEPGQRPREDRVAPTATPSEARGSDRAGTRVLR